MIHVVLWTATSGTHRLHVYVLHLATTNGWWPLDRLRRMGYLPTDFPSVETLAVEADRNLFKSISQCPSHVLRHLLKDKPTSSRSLRARAHNFVLPPKDNRNFLSRVLYSAICPPMGDAYRSLNCCLYKHLLTGSCNILSVCVLVLFIFRL